METINFKIRTIISKHFLPEVVDRIVNTVISKYSESWRAFHTLKHIGNLLHQAHNKNDVLQLAIIYHDIVYFPWSDTNEEDSAVLFKTHWTKYSKTKDMTMLREVSQLILQTKKHDDTSQNAELFNSWDMGVLKSNIIGLLEWEKEIYHEYNFATTQAYKAARVDFLVKHKACNIQPIEQLIEYVKGFKPRVGYYAGSFNKFHEGHLSIVEQAKKLFDKVVIVVAQNPEKPSLSNDELDKISADIFEILGSIEVLILPKDKFLPQLLKERCEFENVTLIRGVRNTQDWAYESNQSQYMKAIWDKLNIIYLSCPKELEHVSSSGIRMMNKIQQGSGDIYLPKKIIKI